MFCPVCQDEYQEGYVHCADCDVSLVDKLPVEEVEYADLVVLTTVRTPVDAQFLISLLGGEGIYAHAESDDCAGLYPSLQFSHGTRIMVERKNLEQSQQILSRKLEQGSLPIEQSVEGNQRNVSSPHHVFALTLVFVLVIALVFVLAIQGFGSS